MSKLVFALLVTVLGLAVVFSVLAILTFLASSIKVVNKIPSRKDRDRKAKKKAAALETASTANLASAPADMDPDERNAVIAAAIAAYLDAVPSAVPASGIVVRSVRRTSSKWNHLGRMDRLSNRI